MKTGFETFLSQMNFLHKEGFSASILDHVIAKKGKKAWDIYFKFPKALNPKEIVDFTEKANTYLRIDGIEELSIKLLNESKDYSHLNMLEYYEFIINDISKTKGRFLPFKNFKVEYEPNKYNIYVDEGSASFCAYESAIKNHFLKFGMEVEINICIDNSLKSILEEMTELAETETQKALEQVKDKPEKPVKVTTEKKYKPKGSLNNKAVPISDIPCDQLGLAEYTNLVGMPFFVICGEVFSSEFRKLSSKSTLFSFKITDENDSILVNRFGFNEDEVEMLKTVKEGTCIKVFGEAVYDHYARDIVIKASEIMIVDKIQKAERTDNSIEKRVELHAHTIMSNMDSVATPKEYIDIVNKWGHKAIAFTDHDGVYSFPDIAHACEKTNIKPIYGVELSLIDEEKFRIAYNKKDIELDNAIYTVFDIETTGFSVNFDSVIEIGACKYKGFELIDTFQEFIKIDKPLPNTIKQLTNISDEMLLEGKDRNTVLKAFREFSKGSILVAHNASFDIGHIYENFRSCQIEFEDYAIIDTMFFAQALHFDDMKFFNLDALVKFFKVKLESHHRAIDDAKATAECFMLMLAEAKKKNITNYQDLNSLIREDSWKAIFDTHVTILAKNQTGYKNLFKIVSDSLTTHIYKKPRLLKSVLKANREGLLIGSSCVNGEIFETALNKSYQDLLNKMDFYDYIEVQPPDVYAHLRGDTYTDSDKMINDTIKTIVKASLEKEKIVVATSDAHYVNPNEQKYRDIYLRTPVVGGGKHRLSKHMGVTKQHLRTTPEMLKEFNDLFDPNFVYDLVIKNTNIIADMIEPIAVFPKGLFAPADDEFKDTLGVPSIEEELKRMVMENAHKLYGKILPEIVEKRLDKELNSIITNKFSSVYYMSHLLVKKSLDDGYLVGSRGSVGSSLVATMMNITEVNPLSPHYRCPRCCFTSFKMNEEEKKKYGVRNIEVLLQSNLDKVESGFDLPNAVCPICGTALKKDGHDIPFETFLGFEGNKTPDIDLNFSGEYQGNAHEYVRFLMGNEGAFRAGTISTVAEKTAFGYVKGYLEEKQIILRNAEVERLAKKIEGAKRSTGQHPGGIVVVPSRIDIYDVTPIQYPADDPTNSFRTTHFDYHSFESNLLKLDILGHDDPTMIRYLMNYVVKHPNEFPFSDARDIPVDDHEVVKLFSGTESIKVSKTDISSDVASFAVPEFGTDFVRQMLGDTKPQSFAELVKISGLSHGTDVWLNNAQALVLGQKTEYGKIDFKDVIGCRDDIMVYLMYQGLEPSKAFDIMEFVRRGKPSKDKEKWAMHVDYMRKKGIPEWYIWSCGQIQYMFPKAHATAYVLMALRIAWFKVHKPLLFYSGFFSKRVDTFDIETMCSSANGIRNKIAELSSGKTSDNDETLSAKKASDLITTLKVALEMVCRGFKFKIPDINTSLATDFVIDEDSLIFPFSAIDGLGASVAINIVETRNIEPFTSRQDLLKRTKINKTVFDRMDKLGVLKDLEEKEEVIVDIFAYQY